MSTLVENDFQIKLKAALKISDYEVPPISYLEKVENSLDKSLKDNYYSERELSTLIKPRNCSYLITTHTYNKILYFLKYVSQNYKEMTPSADGMTEYINKYSITAQIRPILIEIGELTFEGNKVKRSYKWSGSEVTPDFVYHICVLLNDKKKEFRDNTAKYTPEHDQIMKVAIKDGKDFDWLMRNRYDMFKGFSNGSVRTKFSRMSKSIQFPKVGQVTEVSRTNGLIPNVNSKFNIHLIDSPYKTKWCLDEILALQFFLFNGKENMEIAEIMKKNTNQVAQKKFALKRDGALKFSATQMFLTRNNKRLNELFTENKKEEEEVVVDPNLKLDLDNTNDFETPLKLIPKGVIKEEKSDLDKTLNVLYLEIASNKQQLKKEKKRNKKMKKQMETMKNKIEFLDQMLTRFLKIKVTS
jgi:hypothetical protein